MSGDVTLRIRIDTDRFSRAMHDAGQTLSGIRYSASGLPQPPRQPYPRTVSDMTAREYRTARRAYRRALTAWTRRTR